MDANYLPELCMKEILTNLKNHPSGLLKCSLLNRHWNHYFLPELWKNPFKENLESKINTKKLIETFVNCLTINEKRSIINNNDINYKNPYLMYTKYLQVIDLNKLVNYITFTYPVNNHLQIYKLLCFNFLANSKNITTIILSKHSVFNNNTDLFLYSNSRNLSTLKEIEFNGLSLSNLIYNCRKIYERNDYYSDEDEDIVDIDINFQFNNNIISKLNFLKFENCNQFGFYDNQSLIILIFGKSLKRLHIVRENDSNHLRSVNLLSNDLRSINLLSTITKRCENLEELQISRYCNQIHLLKNCYLIFSICGQNLNYLYIRGKEILEITKNVNLLLILSTNCNNLKLLKLSITEKYFNYIPSLFTSCQKLQFISFNNYDQRNLINIDLSKIGLTLPLSLKKFTMKMNLYFTPENFKEFLINIKDKLNLEVLNFKRCELFDNDHLNMLINYNNGNLKRLKINASIKVDYDVLSKANQFLKIENPKLENISLDINQIREMMPIED
ncbi:hypothetical protein GLOIN_2v1774597 [Rhizophagus irregularis DAOM 181602=DAOM 197198]|nr:hypothetical protein GLOIN_2v1774597 [Rhizophagus irregularis DAOM 181602=DAOM 197198]